MSYLIPIGGIVRHVTYCTVPGQAATNTRKWQLVSLSSGTSFPSDDALAFLDLNLSAVYANVMSTNSVYYGSQLYLMNPIGLPPRPSFTVANQQNGSAGAGLQPGQVSGLISLYSSTLGKVGQGRVYIPFPCPDENFTDGTPTAGYVTRLDDIGIFLKTNALVVAGGITATFRPCLYRGGTDTPRFIESFTSHDAWATQRRRGAFGRLNKAPF